MEDLREYHRTALLDGLDDFAPAFGLFLCVEVAGAREALAAFGDGHAFGEEEAGRVALGVVLDHEVVGDAGAGVGAHAGHGGHDDAVGDL